MNKQYYYNNLIYILLGFCSTGAVLALVVGGHVLSFFSIFLFLAIFELLIKKNKNEYITKKNNSLERYFLLWMAISVLSIFFGCVFFLGMLEWQATTLAYLPKIFLYTFFFTLLKKKASGEKINGILLGIKWGMIVNLIWCILDASIFYATGQSITNTVFAGYIQATDTRDGMLSLIDGTGTSIRSGGLNGDPSNIGLFATVIASYGFLKNKNIYVILSAISSFASVSFIAIVGIFIAFASSRFYKKCNSKLSIRGLAVVVLLLFCGIMAYNSNSEIITGLKTALELRAESKKDSDDASVGQRLLYIEHFPEAISNIPSSLIIGTGYMTASYPYVVTGIRKTEFSPFDFENCYLSYFFDLGLIGFIIFLLFYIRSYLVYRKRSSLDRTESSCFIFSCTEGAIISFLFYHYTLYSVTMLICLISVILYGRNFILKSNGEKRDDSHIIGNI